jgi:osmotically-inducible protein OsmY
MKDDQLADDVRQALMLDDRLSEHPIAVTARGGIVRLEGVVQDHRRKLAAVNVATSFVGHERVDDAIVVQPPVASADADGEIADAIRRSLEVHSDVARSTVTIDVRNGVVTLSGSVRDEFERARAEDVALAANGVRRVRNLLLVDAGDHARDEAISRRIRRTLDGELGTDGSRIRVAIAGDTAVLSGVVPTPWHREKSEEIARRSRILHVRNKIDVQEPVVHRQARI